MYKATDLAYLAGFIDGEGCFFIGLFKTKSAAGNITPNYHTYIKICNTEGSVMRWIRDTFGGTNYNQWKSTDRKKLNDKEIHNVQITGQNLTDLLPLIYPYLIVKKAHCEIMMKMRKTFPEGKRLSKYENNDEIHNLRYSYMLELRKLNSRFHDHPLKEQYILAPCCPILPKQPIGVPSQSEQI